MSAKIAACIDRVCVPVCVLLFGYPPEQQQWRGARGERKRGERGEEREEREGRKPNKELSAAINQGRPSYWLCTNMALDTSRRIFKYYSKRQRRETNLLLTTLEPKGALPMTLDTFFPGHLENPPSRVVRKMGLHHARMAGKLKSESFLLAHPVLL